jgi:hypothetical protein
MRKIQIQDRNAVHRLKHPVRAAAVVAALALFQLPAVARGYLEQGRHQ